MRASKLRARKRAVRSSLATAARRGNRPRSVACMAQEIVRAVSLCTCFALIAQGNAATRSEVAVDGRLPAQADPTPKIGLNIRAARAVGSPATRRACAEHNDGRRDCANARCFAVARVPRGFTTAPTCTCGLGAARVVAGGANFFAISHPRRRLHGRLRPSGCSRQVAQFRASLPASCRWAPGSSRGCRERCAAGRRDRCGPWASSAARCVRVARTARSRARVSASSPTRLCLVPHVANIVRAGSTSGDHRHVVPMVHGTKAVTAIPRVLQPR